MKNMWKSGLAIVLLAAGWFWLSLDQAAVAADSKTTVFQVQGMTCGSCVMAIKAELAKKPGMIAMEADLERGLVRVEHAPPLNGESIAQSISRLGYPARVLPEGAAMAEPGGSMRNCGNSCGTKGCGAVVSSWRELFRKIFPGKNS